jgi:hypothetical protein
VITTIMMKKFDWFAGIIIWLLIKQRLFFHFLIFNIYYYDNLIL